MWYHVVLNGQTPDLCCSYLIWHAQDRVVLVVSSCVEGFLWEGPEMAAAVWAHPKASNPPFSVSRWHFLSCLIPEDTVILTVWPHVSYPPSIDWEAGTLSWQFLQAVLAWGNPFTPLVQQCDSWLPRDGYPEYLDLFPVPDCKTRHKELKKIKNEQTFKLPYLSSDCTELLTFA